MKRYQECPRCKWIVAEKDFVTYNTYIIGHIFVNTINICKDCAEMMKKEVIRNGYVEKKK